MWLNILVLALQALTTRNVAFAVTIGVQHLAVTIVQNATPGNSGTFWEVLQIVGRVLTGQTGVFTIGVFTVTIALLAPVPAPIAAHAPAAPTAASEAAEPIPAGDTGAVGG